MNRGVIVAASVLGLLVVLSASATSRINPAALVSRRGRRRVLLAKGDTGHAHEAWLNKNDSGVSTAGGTDHFHRIEAGVVERVGGHTHRLVEWKNTRPIAW